MRFRLFILFYLLCYLNNAQNNLVPNGSFETIQNFPPSCSTNTDESITDAVYWMNPNNATPSIFNEIDTSFCFSEIYPFLGVPLNVLGWQQAHSGKGYADIEAFGFYQKGLNAREYIQTKLIDTLKRNKTYCMSFYVSLMDSFSNYATSRIGCYLSQNAVNNFTQELISVVPQIENPYNNFITSKTTWTEIKGIYTAGGGENYITVGNFYDDYNTDTIFSPGIGQIYLSPNDHLSGYYIDDVSLTEYNTANAGRDTTICKGVYASLGNYQNSFGAMYNWSVLKGDSGSFSPLYDTVSYTFTNPKKTTTYVLQKQQCGIFSYDTITVKIPASYTANAGRDTTICIGDTAVIGINNCSWCNYSWQNINANAPVLSVYPLTTTTYTLHLKDSCNTTSSLVTITVDYCQSPVIVMPNIFTPNGDDINDSWQPIIQNPLSMLNYQCTIYDRWGIKVFETTNYATGFDGHTTSGIAASTGTYFYVLSYTDAKTNETKMLKGFLELVR